MESDLRDETSLRTGVRIVIDVRKDANASVILNNLYKQTPLQTSFGVNMIALVNGRPKLIKRSVNSLFRASESSSKTTH